MDMGAMPSDESRRFRRREKRCVMSPTAQADVRDGNGRFGPGNPGGPGRPRRAVEREYLAALTDAVTLDDWRAVCAKAVEQARAGDRYARAWLAGYLLGSDDPEALLARVVELESRVGGP